MRKAKEHLKIVFIILIIVFCQKVKAQTIRDYFMPDPKFNKANFYLADSLGERITFMTKEIYYTDNNDGSYDVMKVSLSKDTPASIVTQTIQFTTTEVKMTKSISWSIFFAKKTKNYNSAEVLSKMPPPGQSIAWSTIDEGGKPINFNASWTTVAVEGEYKKAIKLVCKYTEFRDSQVDYYVKGIGLMRSEWKGPTGRFTPSSELDGLSYEP